MHDSVKLSLIVWRSRPYVCPKQPSSRLQTKNYLTLSRTQERVQMYIRNCLAGSSRETVSGRNISFSRARAARSDDAWIRRFSSIDPSLAPHNTTTHCQLGTMHAGCFGPVAGGGHLAISENKRRRKRKSQQAHHKGVIQILQLVRLSFHFAFNLGSRSNSATTFSMLAQK